MEPKKVLMPKYKLIINYFALSSFFEVRLYPKSILIKNYILLELVYIILKEIHENRFYYMFKYYNFK